MAVPRNDVIHPFLRGNFAPVTEEFISHPCQIILGEIPSELLGGQYIRNGGNPVHPPDKGRPYHWFDGDGMLHGVLFPTSPNDSPSYTNRHLATPLLTLTLLLLQSPLPSIALLVAPLSSLHKQVRAIFVAFLLAVRARVGVLSVANTNVLWWGPGLGSEAAAQPPSSEQQQLAGLDPYQQAGLCEQRLLATCESGPPLEIRVPELETVGWDRLLDSRSGEDLNARRGPTSWWTRWGLARVQEDWMTAHPRVDPVDGSLIFYTTAMFDKPHARYSVVDRHGNHLVWKQGIDIGRPKMMHDFACSRNYTVLLNLPLTLAPSNLFSRRPQPLLYFDRSLPSEFIVFPRLFGCAMNPPTECTRFREAEPSLIFHTANAWDEYDAGEVVAVNLLGCRFNSAKLVYSAGFVEPPASETAIGEDVVRLHYYRFELPATGDEGRISHSFPLSAIPFEFPTVPHDLGMSNARYVYGCTMGHGSFDERLGGAAKVDCLVKLDVDELIRQGRARGLGRNLRPVDERSTMEILRDWQSGNKGPIEVFALPPNMYAQEVRFVPRTGDGSAEDDGYLLTYVYDETNLLPDGSPSKAPSSGSELWVIDAHRMGDGMSSVVCRVQLPQRVPYGLHGTWLPPHWTARQRRLHAPLAPQKLLQEKLHESRLQYFTSIIFDRPSRREISLAESCLLFFLWPAAVGSLVLGMCEIYDAVSRRFDAQSSTPQRDPRSEGLWSTTITLAAIILTMVVRSRR